MPPYEALLPFVLGILVLQLSPGPDMLLILDRGLTHGTRIAFSTIAGIVLVAGAVQLALLVLGLGTLLHDHPSILIWLRAAGAAYLCYLGLRMMATPFRGIGARPRPVDTGTALREGALNSLTNPKTCLFLFVVLPQFADPSAGPVWLQMLVLGALHKLASFTTLGAVALAAGRIGRWTRRWPHLLPVQRHLCGALLVALGAGMALRQAYPA
ncbi:lysine transporter LysE [Aureimonas endophytica]|uniref:Lysine transporter LysE n=1 Tax=Aureimonas endophytica TaxID=2027858 RepID=A0A916ZT17_9HYPH|nr:LysE family translocator [Aureimonas endophytica]GGE12484.1 lysine transporter LysE [Aureimonas endophytica]